MVKLNFYDEIADFLATAAPAKILEFRPSEATQRRFEELLFLKKEDRLNEKELAEMSHYLMLEHIFRLAKGRAAAQLAVA